MISELLNALASPYLGNAVGIVSLIVGAVGLIYTIITYIKTKVIEKKIPEAKADAIDEVNFHKNKEEAICFFEKQLETIVATKTISKEMCNKIMQSCLRMEKTEKGLCESDKIKFIDFREKISQLLSDEGYKEKNSHVILMEILVEALAILKKGVYAV